jgi:hypothetical protein
MKHYMTKKGKQARKAGIRTLQQAGYFQPARRLCGNGVGERAHLIEAAARGCAQRRNPDPFEDYIEVEE